MPTTPAHLLHAAPRRPGSLQDYYAFDQYALKWSRLSLGKAPFPVARSYHGFTATDSGTSKAVMYMHGGFNDSSGERTYERGRRHPGSRTIGKVSLLSSVVVSPQCQVQSEANRENQAERKPNRSRRSPAQRRRLAGLTPSRCCPGQVR